MAAVPPPLETLIDDRAPQIPGGRPFSGGTRILADQALCPFRAFAHHRLHAERLEAVDLGLDGLARGTLVHGVLERFWRQIDHRDALLQLDPRHQAELLTAAAEATLHAYERRSRCDLPPRLRQLEGRRLVAAAAAWLAVERRREPFRIAAVEQRQVVTVGRLQLRTRIDRIDALADGTLAVIDYKTGRPSPQQWLDPRVTEPQLPLYCLDLVAAPIGAVLFGVVRGRPAECTFKGVARTPDTWPGLSSRNQERLLAERGWRDLDEVIAHWRQVLPQLGDAFANGCATVDPIDPLQVCKDCDLPTLCRYTAQLAIAGDPAATEADHD
jgi:probable DNA repair protein